MGEALGEADGEVVVLDAALFFPEVAWAGFEGEGGGVVFDGVEAEGGADIDAVVEVSDAVVPCVGEDACVEWAAERVVPRGVGVEVVGGFEAVCFAVDVIGTEVEFVGWGDVAGEEASGEVEIVRVAGGHAVADGSGDFPWADGRGGDLGGGLAEGRGGAGRGWQGGEETGESGREGDPAQAWECGHVRGLVSVQFRLCRVSRETGARIEGGGFGFVTRKIALRGCGNGGVGDGHEEVEMGSAWGGE